MFQGVSVKRTVPADTIQIDYERTLGEETNHLFLFVPIILRLLSRLFKSLILQCAINVARMRQMGGFLPLIRISF